MANNRLKYTRIDAKTRSVKREYWNQAVFWPLLLTLCLLLLLLIPALIAYQRRNRALG
jgi:hypothetical protein